MAAASRRVAVYLMLTAALLRADARPPLPALYFDSTKYPPFHLTWNTSTDIQDVVAVFPHPLRVQRAALATSSGLLLTEDSGRTWTPLPGATADKVGTILDVAFHPLLPDTFYIASQTQGIWATTDGGKTFTQIGTKAGGMASDTVVSLCVYAGDSSHQTLLAVHGDAAPGLSRSRDGGKTWEVVNADYRFRRLLTGEGNLQQLYLFGSTVKDPDVQCVYSCSTVGEFVTDAVHDVLPTDMVYAPTLYRKPAIVYLSTSDTGLSRIDNLNSAGLAFNVTPLPFKDASGFASVGSAWGPSADAINLFAYDPAKLGLVVSRDDFATYQTASAGLPTSSLVKEGAMLRPNANGTVFYAVANGSLSIGRQPDDVPVVDFTPAAFEVDPDDNKAERELAEAFQKFTEFKGHTTDAATALLGSVSDLEQVYRQHQIAVTARVPVQPSPPKSVTVDLSRYGGYPNTPLYDDGQHNDGVAGDGVYGLTFAFLPERHPPREDEWRPSGPGRVAMGVTATYADGHSQGAVGVVEIFAPVLDIGIWHDGVGSVAADPVVGATVEPFLNPLDPGQPSYAPRLHKGDVAVRLKVPKGPWEVHFKAPYNRHNIDGHPAFSFFIRLDDGPAPTALKLQLRDEPDFSPPTTTDAVSVLQGITLTGTYQRVVFPMTQVVGTALQFQRDHLAEIIFSGESPAPATLVLDGMQANATNPPAPPPPEPAK
jgi:hypothetical protein